MTFAEHPATSWLAGWRYLLQFVFSVLLFGLYIQFSVNFSSGIYEKIFVLRSVAGLQRAFAPPPPFLPPACFQVGHDPNKQTDNLPNSRFLCTTSAICLRPNTPSKLGTLYLAAPPERTTCDTLSPDLTPAPSKSTLSCDEMRTERVLCAHGCYANRGTPQHCPPVAPLASLSEADNASSTWVAPDRVAVVVPAYPWTGNIFHYTYVIGYLTHLISDLERVLALRWGGSSGASPTRVTLIFRGPVASHLVPWNAAVTGILFRRRLAAAGIFDISVQSLGEDEKIKVSNATGNTAPLTCAHSAVLLGTRGYFNLWPFANSTAVSTAGDSVPAQAVAFRRAVYDEVNVPVRLPPLPRRADGNKFVKRFVFDPPPLAIGYARRLSGPDPPPGGRLEENWRRFSPEDEEWFRGMLRGEGSRVGATYREVEVTSATSFGDQVRWFADVGLVVGIHGANLVNALFAPPFSGLIEVMPGGHKSDCYLGGENAGLMYTSYTAANATREESFCQSDQRCWPEKYRQHRRVKVGTNEHRTQLRQLVRNGLARIVHLRQRFPNGMPTSLQLPEQRYVLDE